MRQHRAMERTSIRRAVASVTLLGAGVVHAIVVPQHLHEWVAAGVFFVILAVVEAIGAAVVWSDRMIGSRLVVNGLVAVTAGTIALWAVSRTVGLPFGPDPGMPEAVGAWDIAATTMELITLVALLWPARVPSPVTAVRTEPSEDRAAA